MTKQELKKAENGELIADAIRTFGFILRGEVIDRGTKKLEKHFQDCGAELVKRGLMSQDEWNSLNK